MDEPTTPEAPVTPPAPPAPPAQKERPTVAVAPLTADDIPEALR